MHSRPIPGRGYPGATPAQRRRRRRPGLCPGPAIWVSPPSSRPAPCSRQRRQEFLCTPFPAAARTRCHDGHLAGEVTSEEGARCCPHSLAPGNYGSPPAGIKSVCDGRATATGERAWSTDAKTVLTPFFGSRIWRRSGNGGDRRTSQAGTVAGRARRVPDRNGPLVSIDQPRRAGVRSSNLGCGLAAGCCKGGVPCAMSCSVSS